MATITLLDDGSDATQGLQKWSIFGGSGNLVSSTAHPHTGPRAYRITSDGNANAPSMGAQACLADAGSRISCWVYFEQLPAATSGFLLAANSGFGTIFEVRLSAAGVLSLFANAVNKTGSTLSAATYYRIGISLVITTLSNFTIKVFLDGVLDVTLTQADVTLVNNTATYLLAGWFNGSDMAASFHLDDLYVDAGTDLADAGDIRVTAKLPGAANANNFDTTGGTGAVNERPLSATNYKQHAAISTVSQNYAIEAAADGDVDISAATQVGYGGWIWAKGTAGGAGTPKITLNGADTAIVLTASAAYYAVYVTSATYPSNAATIGMISTNDADDTFLYEAGVLVAYTPAASGISIPVVMAQYRQRWS